jgi:hypothetical protein
VHLELNNLRAGFANHKKMSHHILIPERFSLTGCHYC